MSTITSIQPFPMTLPSASQAYRFTVDQYDKLVSDGTLDEHDRVELLCGVLVRKTPQSPDHVWAVDELEGALVPHQSDAWHVRKEHPVRIPEYDEREPDIAVARGSRAALRGRHPGPEDLLLVVEVGGSTLGDDQGVRKERYAIAGIPIYWIVNLHNRRTEVYSVPDRTQGRYCNRTDFGANEMVPLEIDRAEICCIAVGSLMPGRPEPTA
jgi:Uma2 family endonuclease